MVMFVSEQKQYKEGVYEKAVRKITEWIKPNLHKITEDFVDKSVDTYAKDKPRFARMIEFEVRRRGDGAGLTQDVAEPLLWAGIKTGAALLIHVFTHRLKNSTYRIAGDVAALGLLLNNGVELLRLIPRYKAGLQGSLEMAKDRWRSLEQSGIDPFDNREKREIKKLDSPAAGSSEEKSWNARITETRAAQENVAQPNR